MWLRMGLLTGISALLVQTVPAQAQEPAFADVVNYVYTSDVSFIEMSDLEWLVGAIHYINGEGCCENTEYDYAWVKDRYGYLDWSNDGCSILADRAFYYDFTRACLRHDFSYRNWKNVEAFRRAFNLPDPDAWNETKRHTVDDTFHVEMQLSCEGRWFFERGACQREADIWHNAIRWLGNF